MSDIKGSLSGNSTLHGAIATPQGVSAALSNKVFIKTQIKTVTPGDSVIEVTPDGGFAGLSKVIVEPIPNSYGHIVYDGTTLLVM